jgi:hypothetical protein
VAVTVLLCYAREDERMAGKLKKHLSGPERNGLIALWDDGHISAGARRDAEIQKHLDEAQVILLLITADFIGSDYCYEVQMQRAIERHERKEARVIPVILRDVSWNYPPLDKLQALPDHARPVLTWATQDKGFLNVVDGIMKVVEQWDTGSLPGPTAERRALIANFDRLIETVKTQMQGDPGRVANTASTLEELSVFIPNDVTLADLISGWHTLSHPAQQEEDLATTRRRATCGELAQLASQLTIDQGNLAQAIKTWEAWEKRSKALEKSGDRRQAAMAKTFARELAELQAAL